MLNSTNYPLSQTIKPRKINFAAESHSCLFPVHVRYIFLTFYIPGLIFFSNLGGDLLTAVCIKPREALKFEEECRQCTMLDSDAVKEYY